MKYGNRIEDILAYYGELQEKIKKLGISYERVDNDPASSMEECADIGKVFQAPVRKDVFLCNQKLSLIHI